MKKQNNNKRRSNTPKKNKKDFPNRFPFWARLKISKNRTTLVIDEEKIFDKNQKKEVDGYVHREAIHKSEKNSNRIEKDYEKIIPNPDKTDKRDMYLKRPSKLPKTLFKPHNKNLSMPKHLKDRYDKNNK